MTWQKGVEGPRDPLKRSKGNQVARKSLDSLDEPFRSCQLGWGRVADIIGHSPRQVVGTEGWQEVHARLSEEEPVLLGRTRMRNSYSPHMA